MSNTLVVGVDGSAHSVQALRWAMAEAARRDWLVKAVTAWLPRPILPSSIPMAVTQPDQPREQDLHRDRLEDIVATATAENPWSAITVLRQGEAPDVLTQEADQDDLLVVGSHGHGRLRTAALGSVSAACVRKARCPVVVIPSGMSPVDSSQRGQDILGAEPGQQHFHPG
ncbi:nucleotide-binding universal stress UspA family protein [Crossiella equi]|uniref:Nucleotide-binding universal stress UspA family protein n=1 Tax=Crossiella equi TaxID=130796 RepID=A0ABS5A822_9PSEU|nr:universal stress protein [Crossiella equi]MBP2471850.1 nucleotide-binding universal stress UspA family protein [Crossiella equi]